VSIDAPSPFGRGSNAPLAGRAVLQIVPPLLAGGDERSTLAVASALIAAGARALVASDPGELASEVQALGGLHLPFPASAKNPVTMSLNVGRLARLIEAEEVDIVHARSRAGAWVASGACQKLRRPLVTTVPGDGPDTSPRSSFDSAIADGDCVIAASQWAADRTADVFPAARMRLRTVRPGFDLAKLATESVSRQRVAGVREGWGAAAHERVVLAPVRLQPNRGPKALIEAAAILKARGLADVRLVLAGDAEKPAFARELDSLAAERGVKPIVVRVGAPADRAAAFVAANAVVFPVETADGVTRSVIEAVGMGALAVVSDVGHAREIVAAPPYEAPQDRSGWLTPPGDAAALADAIEAAVTLGASAREALRARARARIAKFYSLERMTQDTLDAYAEVLRTRR
jgi:glycosyltransferase involved in cell wall biosynthesis